jgi:hypothetical protein
MRKNYIFSLKALKRPFFNVIEKSGGNLPRTRYTGGPSYSGRVGKRVKTANSEGNFINLSLK